MELYTWSCSVEKGHFLPAAPEQLSKCLLEMGGQGASPEELSPGQPQSGGHTIALQASEGVSSRKRLYPTRQSPWARPP